MFWLHQTLYVPFSEVTNQPQPILINCNVERERDPFCTKGVSPNFCARKPDRIFRHPSFCNRFVQCVAGKVYVTRCAKPGTTFSQFVDGCDHAGFYRCNNIGKDNFS